MGIKIKNLQTGEFEKFNIPALKGEKGEPGEIEPSEKVDYIGKQHSKLRDTMNANVDYIIKTAIGEFNYLDYEGQHITATNSIEGHAKSAILSGQTLVNLFQGHTFLADFSNIYTAYNNGVYTYQAKGDYEGSIAPAYMLGMSLPYKPIIGKTYTMFVNQITGGNARLAFTLRRQDGAAAKIYNEPAATNGLHKFTFTHDFEGEYATVELRLLSYTNERILEFKDIMIIEGDWTNVDIPYFTGMQSVKMPVLTTTGKNLFNPTKMIINDGALYGYYKYKNDESVKCTLSISDKDTSADISNIYLGVSKIGINASNGYDWLIANGTITRLNTMCIITNFNFISIYPNNIETLNKLTKRFNIQMEYGEVKTTYEPHKSNILHTPEEVVLRSLPNGVCDTLNTRTGVYTQRIGDDTFIGASDENWRIPNNYTTGNTMPFRIAKPTMQGNGSVVPLDIICDKMKIETPRNAWGNDGYDGEGLSHGTNKGDGVDVRILKSKLPTEDVAGFKQWLSQNPITVQYELATPIVKTVALSDNHVYSYKDVTHYDCSSAEGSLVPTLSVKVPTDTQLTIQEQKATTQTLLVKNMDLQQSIKEVQAMNLAFNTALYNSFNSIREEVEDIKKHVSTNENLEGSF